MQILKFNSVRAKCFRMPYWDARYRDAIGIVLLQSSDDYDTDDEDWYFSRDEPVEGEFIVVKIF